MDGVKKGIHTIGVRKAPLALQRGFRYEVYWNSSALMV